METRFEKIVVVTKKTLLEELIERFNTREQARFYIEHLGASFEEYEAAHERYHAALENLKNAIPDGVRAQFIERAFLPNFVFGDDDLVATLGPDGLVVNTAKYVGNQPLVAFNPDSQRIDGVLIPFDARTAAPMLRAVVGGRFTEKRITMARVDLPDGQSLHALNDLFIGASTHVSARYKIEFDGRQENQSSSGIIVSTGAGSTGWYRSIVTGAAAILRAIGSYDADERAGMHAPEPPYAFDATAEHLVFSVREPFVSKTSQAGLSHGKVTRENPLRLVSAMPQNGVIFSDGVEEDFLQWNSGAQAVITPAERKLRLVQSVT
jgi:NAD kinase